MVFVPGRGSPKEYLDRGIDFPYGRRAKLSARDHGVDFPTFDKWYRKTHKKVYPITVTGMPAEKEAKIQAEAEKVSEEKWINPSIIAIPYQGILNLWKKTS